MEMIYSDQDIIVCIKPIGLDSEKDVPLKLKEQFQGEIFTVHRLDFNVGGVMVYARNKKTAAYLSKIIQEGNMIKEYIAKVHGVVKDEDVLEDLLFKDSKKNKVFVVKRKRHGVKDAKLKYKRLYVEDENSIVHIRLYTGRSHQIRVQFSSRGFPLIGDHKYGSKAKETAPLLYSHKITFPYHKETISFESYPDWMKNNDVI